MKNGLYDYREASEKDIKKIIGQLNKRVLNDRTNILEQLGFLEFENNQKILDLGCGPGSVDLLMFEKNPKGTIHAIDLEERFIEEAKSKLSDDEKDKIIYSHGSCYDLPYEDNFFDCCYSRLVFDHLSDPVKALLEIKRVVKPGGRIGIYCRDELLTCYHPMPRHFYKISFAYQQLTRFTGGSITRGRELFTLLLKNGLDVVQLKKYITDVYTLGREVMQDEFMMFDDLLENHILLKAGLVDSKVLKEYYEDIEKITLDPYSYIALFDFFVVGIQNK